MTRMDVLLLQIFGSWSLVLRPTTTHRVESLNRGQPFPLAVYPHHVVNPARSAGIQTPHSQAKPCRSVDGHGQDVQSRNCPLRGVAMLFGKPYQVSQRGAQVHHLSVSPPLPPPTQTSQPTMNEVTKNAPLAQPSLAACRYVASNAPSMT